MFVEGVTLLLIVLFSVVVIIEACFCNFVISEIGAGQCHGEQGRGDEMLNLYSYYFTNFYHA